MPAIDAEGKMSDYHLQIPLRMQLISFQPQKEDLYYTLTSLEPDLSVYISMNRPEAMPILSSELHHHNYYELMFILEGNVYQKIENRRHLYTTGSCCLLNRNVRHSEEYLAENGAFRILFLQLSDEYLQLVYKLFFLRTFKTEQSEKATDLEAFLQFNLSGKAPGEKDYVDFIPRTDREKSVRKTHQIFDQLAFELVSPGDHPSFRCMSLIILLLQLLVSKEEYSTTPVRIGSQKENQLFEEIIYHMEQSGGRISRNELSRILHYSGSHMNRVMQKITGMSLSEYGMSVSMKEAARLLKDSDISVQEIVRQMCFSNRSHFYRKFEEIYQMTPVQYRKSHKL